MFKKLMRHWVKISIWRKSFYISFIGTILWFLKYVIQISLKISKNNSGIYQCAISVDKPCGLMEYIFKSDNTVLFYISSVLIFILLVIITSIISYLIILYRKGNKLLFWILVTLILLIAILSPFIINYLQLVM